MTDLIRATLNLRGFIHGMEQHQRLGPVRTYRDLIVWQKGKPLAIDVCLLCETHGMRSRFGLRDQMTRAAISIPSNIAEGDERGTNKDSLKYLIIARASLAELETQIEITIGLNAINTEEYDKLHLQAQEVGRLIGGTIRMRQLRLNGSPPEEAK